MMINSLTNVISDKDSIFVTKNWASLPEIFELLHTFKLLADNFPK